RGPFRRFCQGPDAPRLAFETWFHAVPSLRHSLRYAFPMPAKAVTKSATKKLPPPQRAAAIEGVPSARAKKIAAREPVSPKSKHGKTKNPLAPDRIAAILDALRQTYPNVVCALNHRNAFELTIATILSAQTTDVGVNK